MKDQTILVTGAAIRLGRALAERFLTEEARVIAHYHHSDKDAQQLVQRFPNVRLFRADLKSPDEVERFAKWLRDENIRLTGVVISAGIFYPTPWGQATEKQWDDLMSLNARAPFFLLQALRPQLTHQSWITTIMDIYGSRPLRNYPIYSASKAAVGLITKSIAREWAPKSRANTISPGAVLLPEDYTPEQRTHFVKHQLLAREGKPEDIVEAAVFLAKNQYVNGLDLVVDGGSSLL